MNGHHKNKCKFGSADLAETAQGLELNRLPLTDEDAVARLHHPVSADRHGQTTGVDLPLIHNLRIQNNRLKNVMRLPRKYL